MKGDPRIGISSRAHGVPSAELCIVRRPQASLSRPLPVPPASHSTIDTMDDFSLAKQLMS